MDKLLTLSIPGAGGTPTQILAPKGIPTHIPLGNLAGNLLAAAIGIGILLSLLYLVYGGFYWMQSKGDKENLDKARRIILYAIIGLIVMMLSLFVVNLITAALGVETLINRPT